ncbi:hypothetical protein Tco_0757334 [Tanacetum coccineum]
MDPIHRRIIMFGRIRGQTHPHEPRRGGVCLCSRPSLLILMDSSNNEAEYKALVAGLQITEQMGVKNLVDKAEYVVKEIHEGSCSKHSGLRSVVAKAIRSRSADQAQTLANSVVRSIAGKESKHAVDGDSGYLPEDKLWEIYKKHYNQILPIMTEKVHKEKLQESESCNRRMRPKKRRKPRSIIASRGTRPSQSMSVFSRLRREGDKPTCQRSPATWSDRRNPFFENENDQGGHWKSRPRKRRSNGEDNLSQSWLCEDSDPFTARIRYFKVPKKTRMPTNVKTYDGTGDPEDHLKNLQVAAKIEWWAMPTWCQMFNSTLIGSARVWFDKLQKYIKDPVEIHHIKQREGESTEAFTERFKAESMHVNGAPECMRISRKNDEHENSLPKGRDSSGQSIKKESPTNVETPRNKPQTKLQQTVRFRKSTQSGKARRQIEEAVRSGQLSHLVKEIKQGGKRGEHAKATKKGETPNKEKAMIIFKVQPWQGIIRQKTSQSFFACREMSFSPLTNSSGQENSIVIEAEVEWNLIHHMYVDGGSASEVLYMHCFNKLHPEIKKSNDSSYNPTFRIQRSPSPCNGIIGHLGLRKIQAVLSIAHGMVKFPVDGGIVTLRSNTIIPTEYKMVVEA